MIGSFQHGARGALGVAAVLGLLIACSSGDSRRRSERRTERDAAASVEAGSGGSTGAGGAGGASGAAGKNLLDSSTPVVIRDAGPRIDAQAPSKTHGGVTLPAGGTVMRSPGYRLTVTVGESPGGNGVMSSPGFRLKRGFEGVTE